MISIMIVSLMISGEVEMHFQIGNISKFKFQLFARGRKNGIDIGKYHWTHIFIYLDRGFPIWYSVNFHHNPLETKLCCISELCKLFFISRIAHFTCLCRYILTYNWATIKLCGVPVVFLSLEKLRSEGGSENMKLLFWSIDALEVVIILSKKFQPSPSRQIFSSAPLCSIRYFPNISPTFLRPGLPVLFPIYIWEVGHISSKEFDPTQCQQIFTGSLTTTLPGPQGPLTDPAPHHPPPSPSHPKKRVKGQGQS